MQCTEIVLQWCIDFITSLYHHWSASVGSAILWPFEAQGEDWSTRKCGQVCTWWSLRWFTSHLPRVPHPGPLLWLCYWMDQCLSHNKADSYVHTNSFMVLLILALTSVAGKSWMMGMKVVAQSPLLATVDDSLRGLLHTLKTLASKAQKDIIPWHGRLCLTGFDRAIDINWKMRKVHWLIRISLSSREAKMTAERFMLWYRRHIFKERKLLTFQQVKSWKDWYQWSYVLPPPQCNCSTSIDPMGRREWYHPQNCMYTCMFSSLKIR